MLESEITFEGFAEAFRRYFQLEEELTLSLEVTLEDLGFDSIAHYELVLLLEDVAGFEMPPEVAGDLADLSDVFHFYKVYQRRELG